MNIDLDATLLSNRITDYRQTVYFGQKGIEELNPLLKPLYKDQSKLALAFLAGTVVEHNLLKRHKKELAIWNFILVGLNARNHRIGIPVLSFRF